MVVIFLHKVICSDQNCEQYVLSWKNEEMKMNVKKIFQLLTIKVCCLKKVTFITCRLKMMKKSNKLMTLFVLITLFWVRPIQVIRRSSYLI
jgi:hypothetical protein